MLRRRLSVPLALTLGLAVALASIRRDFHVENSGYADNGDDVLIYTTGLLMSSGEAQSTGSSSVGNESPVPLIGTAPEHDSPRSFERPFILLAAAELKGATRPVYRPG